MTTVKKDYQLVREKKEVHCENSAKYRNRKQRIKKKKQETGEQSKREKERDEVRERTRHFK